MTTKQMTKMTNRKVEQKGLFFRTAEIDRDSIDIENRTVELVFSTETPVDRWWGIEILDHNPKSVRMERMKKGCAVLVNHMVTEHVGVVDRASIDADKKGRARARFGNSVKAKEAFDDVVNDVRKFWSIYYRLHDAILERKGKDGALGTYRVIDWEPYELSLASIPADINAETGREADKSFTFTIREDSDMTKPEVGQEEEARSVQDPPENRHPEISVRAREEIESAARSSEQKRARQILTFGEMFKLPDLARTFINNGKSVDDFCEAARVEVSKREDSPIREVNTPPTIGMSDKEIDTYRMMKAIRACAEPQSKKLQDEAAFEFEVSEAAAKVAGRSAKSFFVPMDILNRWSRSPQQRDLSVGSDPGGGYTVATQLLTGEFIELLSNKTVVFQLARLLPGLVGDVAIPKQTGGATCYWVGEQTAPTESDQAFGQLAMRPKSVVARTDLKRTFIMQTSLGAELFVRDDLTDRMAATADLACFQGTGGVQPLGILNTTGIGLVPIDTNGGAPTWPKVVSLIKEIAVDNALRGSLNYVTNPQVMAKLMTTEKFSGTGREVWQDPLPGSKADGRIGAYPAYATNQVTSSLTKGSGTDLSAILFGNWKDVVVGTWGVLDVLVNPFNPGGGVIRIEAYFDMDLILRHAQSMAVILDAITTM